MLIYPIQDALFATFSSGLWIMVDWEEASLTWNGEPLWFAREGDALRIGLRSNQGGSRKLDRISTEHWERLCAGEGRWVEAGPRGLLCSHPIKLEAGPEGLQQMPPDFLEGWARPAEAMLAVS